MPAWPRLPLRLSATSAPPWLGHLATGLMLMLLAWLCASIYWSLTLRTSARAPVERETDPQRLVQAISTHHLFGVADRPANSGSHSAVSSTSGELRLIGAIAARKAGRPAYALIAMAGSPPEVVLEGNEVAPGIVLQRVLPRKVELLRNGQLLTLSLPEHDTP